MRAKSLAIIFFLIFTSFLTLNAQWAKTYGGSEVDYTRSILQTNDGGYIVLGSTKSFDANIWILKLNISGDIEWQKKYGEGFSVYTKNAYSIQKTNDGGYIIGGSISVTRFGHQFVIIKLSAEGNIIWQKSYGDEDINYVYSLQQTGDGGYIIAGNTGINDAEGHDFLILKLFFDGTVEWSKTYGESGDDKPSSILQTSDGGYIVAGYTNVFGAGSSDIWILKLASDGTIEWQKTYGGSEGENAYSLKHTNDGGYIVAGTILSFGAGQTDFWILKLAADGTIEWQRTYGGIESETAYSIQQTFDGGYIVAGETQSFGAVNKDIWILKLSILGDLEWQKTYGGRQDEEASSIQQTFDGGYIVAGSTDTYGAGSEDLLILKLFPNGDIDSSCIYINDSNADVSSPGIISSNTDLNPEDIVLVSADVDIPHKESEAVVYNLCSEGQYALIISTSSGGTTIPQPGTYIYDYAESISINMNPAIGYNFIGWSGDVISTDLSISITMDSDKSVKANFSEHVLEKLFEDAKLAPCFIATAAFGSPLHPYVRTLQDFRDKYLMSNRSGRRLVKLYYKYSPKIAELITNHNALRTVVRIWLVPIVVVGYSMVHFGPVKTSLMLVLSFMPLFFFVCFYRRRRDPE
ncbi:MAG: hypothetical protein MUP98_07870 [Candidatus Aminicenantes bacterium]|nr:hypothetical protein [Candidatus Aminicenantes bacterium]